MRRLLNLQYPDVGDTTEHGGVFEQTCFVSSHQIPHDGCPLPLESRSGQIPPHRRRQVYRQVLQYDLTYNVPLISIVYVVRVCNLVVERGKVFCSANGDENPLICDANNESIEGWGGGRRDDEGEQT